MTSRTFYSQTEITCSDSGMWWLDSDHRLRTAPSRSERLVSIMNVPRAWRLPPKKGLEKPIRRKEPRLHRCKLLINQVISSLQLCFLGFLYSVWHLTLLSSKFSRASTPLTCSSGQIILHSQRKLPPLTSQIFLSWSSRSVRGPTVSRTP